MIQLVNRFLAAFLKIFFYLLYNPLAWCYDGVAALVSLNHWQEWTRSVLPFLSGERVLELGHGPGHLQVAMHQQGFQVFGLDLSWTMEKQTYRRLEHFTIPARLARGRAQQLPFTANTFDRVVSTFPSEYLFQSQTLSEIYRVLAPGGLLVVLPVAWIRRGSWIERTLAWVFQITHQAPPQEDDQWQTHLLSLFQQVGFQVRAEKIAQPSSEVFLVMASKPNLL